MRITEEDIQKQEAATGSEPAAPSKSEEKSKSRDKDTDFKDLDFGGKLQYLWDYYKWVIVVVAIVIGIIAIVREAVLNSQQKELFHLAMVDAIASDGDLTGNTIQENTELMQQDLLKMLGAEDDPKAFVGIDTNLYTDGTGKALDYNSNMVMTVKVSAQEFDVVLYPKAVYDSFEEKADIFLPMDEVIPEGERIKPEQYTDYCITLDDTSYFSNYGFAFTHDMVLTVIANTKNEDACKQFIHTIGY